MDALTRANSYKIFAGLLAQKKIVPATIAKETGVSPTVFSDWKSNKSAPNTEKLIKIAEYLEVPITIFFP